MSLVSTEWLDNNNSKVNSKNETISEKQKTSEKNKENLSEVAEDKNNGSKVTIVGSTENNELEQKNRTGWWQKLIE